MVLFDTYGWVTFAGGVIGSLCTLTVSTKLRHSPVSNFGDEDAGDHTWPQSLHYVHIARDT